MQLNKLPFALCLAASLSACVVGDGDTDTDAGTGTDPATTDPATTDPATTDPVTTDPVTTDPVTTDPATTDPSSSTDPATTDPGTESESETDVSTSSADSTGTDTGTIGACGWVVEGESGFYACEGDGEDPDGNFDLLCTEAPVAGAECDENSAINGIGCCFEGGNAYCGEDGTIQIDDSCAAG